MALGRKTDDQYDQLLAGFTRQVETALEERRRSLFDNDGLQTLMSAHPQLNEQLLAHWRGEKGLPFAVDALYTVAPTSAASDQVVVSFDVQFVLIHEDRIELLRINRNVQQRLSDDPDLVNRTMLALNRQDLRINQKTVIPMAAAGSMRISYGDGLTPTLHIDQLPEPVPLGSATRAEWVIDALCAHGMQVVRALRAQQEALEAALEQPPPRQGPPHAPGGPAT